MLAKYYLSKDGYNIDYALSEEDKQQIYDPDHYCGCGCCHLTTQFQLFLLRPLRKHKDREHKDRDYKE